MYYKLVTSVTDLRNARVRLCARIAEVEKHLPDDYSNPLKINLKATIETHYNRPIELPLVILNKLTELCEKNVYTIIREYVDEREKKQKEISKLLDEINEDNCDDSKFYVQFEVGMD